jgi:hypothetical protein
MNIDQEVYFRLKTNIEKFSSNSFEIVKEIASKDNRVLFTITQLLSAIDKPFSLLQYEPLINLLLRDEKLITEVFIKIFTKDNLNQENIVILNHILNSEVYRNILELDDKSYVYETIRVALANCKNEDRRFLVIDDDNSGMINEINSCINTFTPLRINKLYVVNALSTKEYFDTIKKDKIYVDERSFYDLWINSFVCIENLYSLAMGVLYREYESLKVVSSNKDYNKPFTYYADHTTGLLRDFYDSFSEKANYDKLDEISCFCLLYFNLEQRMHSRDDLFAANEDVYHILIEFLMLNPELNIDVVVNEHKKFRYQDAWKSTVHYEGTELIGSGSSRSGSVFTLHDSPIVERIFSPFLMRLFEEECGKSQSENRFIKIIENKIFRNSQTTASNPIFLKRAAIPSLLLGLLTLTSEKKISYKNWLLTVMSRTEGLPKCSEAVFSNLMHLSNYIDKDANNYDHVYDLIIEDTKLSGKNIPTNVFAVQAILFLIKRKYIRAAELFVKFLENPDYLNRDDWEYNTLANLGNYTEYDSSFILKVVKSFIANKDLLLTGKGWNINEVIPYLVELYLKPGDESQEVHKIIVTLAYAENKTQALDSLCAYFLRSLAERDSEKAYLILKEILGGRKPSEVFLYSRDSLISIAEHIIIKAGSVDSEEDKKALLDKAMEIIDLFVDDPDPSSEEDGRGYNYHKKIIDNEDSAIITTVRGHVCWAIQKICLYDYALEKAWKYTDKLLHDKNLHVVYQAVIPLIEIVRRRTKLSEPDRIAVMTAIEFCLENYSQYRSIANHLGIVCSYYRDINEALAAKFIEKLVNSENFGFFIIYFAYFREDQYPEKGTFESRKFKDQIINLIKDKKRAEAIKNIFNQMYRIINENINFLPRIIDPINAYDYRGDLALEGSVLHNVYSIVNQVVENDKDRQYYDIILGIYKKYLRIEREFIETSLKLKEANRFLLDYSHKKILGALYHISKDDYYACAAEVVEMAIINNLYIDHFSIAKSLSNECEPTFIPKAIELLNKLIPLNPEYYEYKRKLELL